MSNLGIVMGGRKWWASTTTALLAVAAVAIYSSGWLTELCQYDRAGIERGELWRLFSGNFAHWSGGHLFWDLAVFALLGILISTRHRIATMFLLVLSCIAISASVYLIHPSMLYYRGLSGIDSALFIYFWLDLTSASLKSNDYKIAFAGVLLIIALAGKTVFEVASGSNLFVVSDNFVPVAAAHVAGILTGVMVFAGSWLFRSCHSWRRRLAATEVGDNNRAKSSESSQPVKFREGRGGGQKHPLPASCRAKS